VNPDTWPKIIEECKANSSSEFACLQGIDIPDTYGNRFLVLGNENFPSRGMLTPDGKALAMTARLSLGFSGHIAVIHRPQGNTTLPFELYRHFQGISVYTYAANAAGKYGLVDDGLAAYQWQLNNASNPVPFAVHELYDPADVSSKGTIGFQEIVPAQDARDAIRYFRYGLAHFFENPQRYYITEGPIITGWSILNKDIGAPSNNRDHWRAVVGAVSPDPATPITEAAVYDHGQIVYHWLPNKPDFSEQLDGEIANQHYFMLVVTDAKGHRAISPHLRTVSRGYFTRCADRQNWFGAAGSYTGIWPSGIHGIWYIRPDFQAGAETEVFGGKHPLATCLSFPFASNAANITDMVVDKRYINPVSYGMDAWRIENTEPSRTYDAMLHVTRWHDVYMKEIGDKYGKGMGIFASAFYDLMGVDATMHSRMAVTPVKPLFPIINTVPITAEYAYRQGDQVITGKLDGKPGTLLDLPAGASVDDLLLLEPLTVSGSGQLGWRAEAGKEVPAESIWHAAYLYVKPYTLRASMGVDGPTPWSLKLTRGKLESVLGVVNLTAEQHGVAGSLKAGGELKMLPVKVHGLNTNWPAALWTPKDLGYYLWNGLSPNKSITGTTSGPPFLAHIGIYEPTGYVIGKPMYNHNAVHVETHEGDGYASLPNDADTAFFIGNTLTATNADLVLSYILWTHNRAEILVHNPTTHPITAQIASPKEIPGKYRVNMQVTVPAGSTLKVAKP